jgi:hypothetical protein
MKHDDEEYEGHPSFGLIGFHRISHGLGRNLLFGSHLDRHHETIELRVFRASRRHNLSRDWVYSEQRGRPLIEVELSPAQFAQLLTTMNVGDGVPCTIRCVDGEHMPPVPDDHESEQVKIYKGFQLGLTEMLEALDGRRKRLEEILSKKSINKADREEIRGLVFGIFQYLDSNAAFVLKSFEESAEKVVTAAKAQVDEFVMGALIKAGMEKLAERFGLPEHMEHIGALPGGGDGELQGDGGEGAGREEGGRADWQAGGDGGTDRQEPPQGGQEPPQTS